MNDEMGMIKQPNFFLRQLFFDFNAMIIGGCMLRNCSITNPKNLSKPFAEVCILGSYNQVTLLYLQNY